MEKMCIMNMGVYSFEKRQPQLCFFFKKTFASVIPLNS